MSVPQYWVPPVDVTDPDFVMPPGGLAQVYADTSAPLNEWTDVTMNEYLNRLWRLTPRLGSDPSNADSQRNARLGLMSRAQVRPEEAFGVYNGVASEGMYGIPGGPLAEAQTIYDLEKLGFRPSVLNGPPTIYIVQPPEPGSGEYWTVTKKVYDPASKEWTTTTEQLPANPSLLGMDLQPGMNVRYETPPGQPGTGDGASDPSTYIALPGGTPASTQYYDPATGQTYEKGYATEGQYIPTPGTNARVSSDESGLITYTDNEGNIWSYDPDGGEWHPGGLPPAQPTSQLPGYPRTPQFRPGQYAQQFGPPGERANGNINFVQPGSFNVPAGTFPGMGEGSAQYMANPSTPDPYGRAAPPMPKWSSAPSPEHMGPGALAGFNRFKPQWGDFQAPPGYL